MSELNVSPVEPQRPNSLAPLLESLADLENLDLPTPARAHLAQVRKHVEELGLEASAAYRQAHEVSQARAKFVSVVTHELRLPLTSIKGYTDLIRQGIVGPINDQQKSFLLIVRSNVDRMTALISDLADMSHAQTGRLKLNPKKITLRDVVDDLLLTLQPKLDEKKQVFTVNIPASLGSFQADQARLAQILSTLLANANRYTPSGGAISLQASSDGNQLRIQVNDTGCGISPEDQKKLFTPFFRSEDEAVREHQGWGIALHVASLLVEMMGGHIGAESELLKGSTFWFTLPLESSGPPGV